MGVLSCLHKMRFLLILGLLLVFIFELSFGRRYRSYSRRYSKYNRPSKSYRRYRSYKPKPSYRSYQYDFYDDQQSYRARSYDYSDYGGVGGGLDLNQIALDALTGVNYVANSGGAVTNN